MKAQGYPWFCCCFLVSWLVVLVSGFGVLLLFSWLVHCGGGGFLVVFGLSLLSFVVVCCFVFVFATSLTLF